MTSCAAERRFENFDKARNDTGGTTRLRGVRVGVAWSCEVAMLHGAAQRKPRVDPASLVVADLSR